jgi:hypothetical protein
MDDANAMARAIERAITSPWPDREMITRAEEAAAWLGLVPERDRAFLLNCVRLLALGHARVPWARLFASPPDANDPRARGVATADGLRMAYKAALGALAKVLHARGLWKDVG